MNLIYNTSYIFIQYTRKYDQMPKPVIYLAIIALLLCALPLPYSYYALVRVTACATFIWGAVVFKNKKMLTHTWIFAIMAVVFNPISPLFFPKQIWFFIDLIAAIDAFLNI